MSENEQYIKVDVILKEKQKQSNGTYHITFNGSLIIINYKIASFYMSQKDIFKHLATCLKEDEIDSITIKIGKNDRF